MSKQHVIERLLPHLPSINKCEVTWFDKKRNNFLVHITDIDDFLKAKDIIIELFPEYSVQLDVVDTFKYQLLVENRMHKLIFVLEINLENFEIQFTRTYSRGLTQQLIKGSLKPTTISLEWLSTIYEDTLANTFAHFNLALINEDINAYNFKRTSTT